MFSDIFKSFILLLTPVLLSAQNLVRNPGFELNSGLPVMVTQWALATDWGNANSPMASPDYLHTGGSGMVQLPNSVFGNVSPFQGQAIMGLCAYHSGSPDFREYVSQNLVAPLVVGKNYTFSFWCSNGVPNGYGGVGVQQLQVDFSASPITQPAAAPLGYTPLFTPSALVYSSGWTQLSFSFTATAPYTNFVIGNFMNDASTTKQTIVAVPNLIAYYFIDGVSLIENSSPLLHITGNDTLCAGNSTTLSAFNSSTFAWADSLAPSTILSTISTITVSPAVSTTYFVYGDTDTASFHLTVLSPTLSLGNDTTLCAGTPLLLNAANSQPSASSYLWQNGSTASTFQVLQQGVYSATVTVDGCPATDAIQVSIIKCEPPGTISMPNVFTPNGDGKNDSFHAIKFDNISEATLTLYNRWGQQLTETSNLQQGWNGYTGSNACPEGTYFWIVRYTSTSGKTDTLSGYVSLLR